MALRLDARVPVTVTAAEAPVLVSGLQEDGPQTAFPIHDRLHLVVYETRC